MKRLPRTLQCALIAAVCGAFVSCARFSTYQTEYRYENGKVSGQISTRVSANTVFASKSSLAQFKALQTDKTQSAQVGSLSQESGGGTNTAANIRAMIDLLNTLR